MAVDRKTRAPRGRLRRFARTREGTRIRIRQQRPLRQVNVNDKGDASKSRRFQPLRIYTLTSKLRIVIKVGHIQELKQIRDSDDYGYNGSIHLGESISR